MRILKIVTTSALVLGVLMLIAWPWVLGSRPAGAEPKVLAQWGVRALIYFAACCGAFLGAAVGAVLVMRRAKLEFRSQAAENLKELIEGTLHDHGRRES